MNVMSKQARIDATPAGRPPAPATPLSKRSWAGAAAFFLSLLIIAALSGTNLKPRVRVFIAGEISTQDVTADQNLLVEDKESTRAKLAQVQKTQPPIFDLNSGAAAHLEETLSVIFTVMNRANHDELERVRWQVAELLDSEISEQSFQLLRLDELQNIILIRVAPWIKEKMEQGVVSDSRLLREFDNGILVRNPITVQETLRTDPNQIRDLSGLRDDLERFLRSGLKRPLRSRKAILELVKPLLHPSLTLNPEATQTRIAEVMAGVEPVYYQIKRGEVILRQGERVTPQAQTKLQALFSKERQNFEPGPPLGLLVMSLLLAAGLVLSPMGKLYAPPSNRDFFLMSAMLLFFAVPAKLLAFIEVPLADKLFFSPGAGLAYAYPVAGAAGLMSLFLPYQSCFFINLILSFACSRLVEGNAPVMIFYFLGAMANTLLIKRAQTRVQVLRSVFPLLGVLLVAWLGGSLIAEQTTDAVKVEPFLFSTACCRSSSCCPCPRSWR